MVIKKYSINIENCSLVVWTLAIVAYFFQFPFSKLSSFIIPFLFIYLILLLPKINIPQKKSFLILLAFFAVYLVFSVCRSINLGIPFARILRFTAILTVIPLCCFIRDENFHKKKEIFLNLAMAKSILLILFGAIIIHFGDFYHLRQWAGAFQLGDIYFLNRFIPKVQVQGNALLVVAFMLDYIKSKKFTLRNIIILGGTLVAGNFAFMLALIAFAFWQGYKYALDFIRAHKYAVYIICSVAFIAVLLLIPYVSSKIEEKMDVSNVVRIQQAYVLLDANPFIGEGLGNWITAKASKIDYNGQMYFELQTLYILNQIGLIGLGAFYAVTLKPIYKAGRTQFIFYLIYLFFSFWNPYCFDATQIITIILIMNAALGDNNDKSTDYSLSSRL